MWVKIGVDAGSEQCDACCTQVYQRILAQCGPILPIFLQLCYIRAVLGLVVL